MDCNKTMCCNRECEDCYPQKTVIIDRTYYNAMLQALHYKQMIEEACDGDDTANHFRKVMTVGDCVHSVTASNMWSRYAMEYCL